MNDTKTITLQLGTEDVNLVLEALGAMPFARVYTLIGRIQEQARSQLESHEATEGAGE